MPRSGTFVLHSSAVPDLPAGAYTVHVEQAFGAPGATNESLNSHLEVTAPRYALPGGQVLSTFPPNRSEGAFSARLPQIVLKRRTLPWERKLTGPPRATPWLALVLLADAEAEFKSAQPIAQCVTAGVTLSGTNDAAVGDTIVVPETVVRQVFPTKEELPLLAHVREVDLSDTELALGDDDGWLAVVLANRLPQPGVRYRACLISLEGQYDLLPDTAEIEPDPVLAINTAFVYPALALNAEVMTYEHQATTGSQHGTYTGQLAADAWAYATAPDAGSSAAETTAPATQTAQFIGDMHTIEMVVLTPYVPLYRFPVLANWQFTCTGAGDFQSLMEGLDVGMLGTPPRPPGPTPPGGKPPPPPTRDAAEILDTGHVALGYTSRLGEPGTAWYRGPLVPRPTSRPMPDGTGALPLLHASDQARRVGPDGRLNLSIAAAFEIGRLLALAEPNIVGALLNWRKEGYEASRRATLIATDPQLSLVLKDDLMRDLADRMGRHVIVDLGLSGAARLGAVIPPIDPGCPIDGLDGLDPIELIAVGFGLLPDVVKGVVVREAGQLVEGLVVPVADHTVDLDLLAVRFGEELGPLRNAAYDVAAGVVHDMLDHRAPGPPGAGPNPANRERGGPPGEGGHR